jgi:hypothetical protein
MIFNIKDAKEVVAYYQYLIGKDFDMKSGRYNITHIVIAPSDTTQFAKFLNVFNQTSDNQIALLRSGCDTSSVRVLLVHHDTWGGNILTSDIDRFLTRMGQEKIYLQTA